MLDHKPDIWNQYIIKVIKQRAMRSPSNLVLSLNWVNRIKTNKSLNFVRWRITLHNEGCIPITHCIKYPKLRIVKNSNLSNTNLPHQVRKYRKVNLWNTHTQKEEKQQQPRSGWKILAKTERNQLEIKREHKIFIDASNFSQLLYRIGW